MAASFPASVRVFNTKVNFTTVVEADHPNSLQEEVVALETTLGTNPQVGTVASPSTGFNNTGANFGTIKARLANVENGVVGDTHVQYVKKAGGDTIQPSAPSTTGLVIRAAASQTADLLTFRDSSDVYVGAVSASGVLNMPEIRQSGDQVISANAAQTLSNKILVAPTISQFQNAQHSHTSTGTGGEVEFAKYEGWLWGGSFYDAAINGGTWAMAVGSERIFTLKPGHRYQVVSQFSVRSGDVTLRNGRASLQITGGTILEQIDFQVPANPITPITLIGYFRAPSGAPIARGFGTYFAADGPMRVTRQFSSPSTVLVDLGYSAS